MTEDEGQIEFWEERYRAARTPWDFGGVPADLRRFLAGGVSLGRVLVPGCGSAYEVQALAEAGNETIGIDFSPAAVERAQTIATASEANLVTGDFFEHPFTEHSFDAIYERTFLCALPVSQRTRYRDRMRALLKPGGLLFGFFFYGEEPDPPPHPLKPGEEDQLFVPFFDRIDSRPSQDPLPLFAGRESWEVWRVKA